MSSVRKSRCASLRTRLHRRERVSQVQVHGLREVAQGRSQAQRSGSEDDQLNPLQYMWWMLTSDYTILIYSLVFIILITLDLVLHAMGIGGH